MSFPNLFIFNAVCHAYLNRDVGTTEKSRYNLRNSHDAVGPFISKKKNTKFIKSCSATLFNKLPPSIKILPTLRSFKRECKKLFLAKAYYTFDEYLCSRTNETEYHAVL